MTSGRQMKSGRIVGNRGFTFGGAGAVQIPRLQRLFRFICEEGFERHVAANFSASASAEYEAAGNSLN